MSVEGRNAGVSAIGVTFAYGFLTAFAIGMVHALPWLGGTFFPVVLTLPVVIIAVVRRCSVKTIALLASMGLLGVFAGYALALFLTVPPPYRSFAALSVVGLVAYDVPTLAVVTTIVIIAASGAFTTRRGEAATFSVPAAWLSLVVLIVLGAAYAFGSGMRSCGGAGWGYLFIMYAPAVFFARPLLAAVPALAFVGGGFLPRYISIGKRALIILIVLGLLAAGSAGFLASTPAAQPCTPL